MKWYTSDQAAASSGAEKGVVDLRRITSVARFESGNKGVFSFIVACEDRNLLLRASSDSDMDKWLRALQTQADRARGGSGMGIITGLFPSMSGSSALRRRGGGKGSKTPTNLQSELDRIGQRLASLESEIILNTDDIETHLRHEESEGNIVDRSLLNVKEEEEGKQNVFQDKEVSPARLRVLQGLQKTGPRTFMAPRKSDPRTQPNPLADLLDFHDSDFSESNDVSCSSEENSPVKPFLVRAVPSYEQRGTVKGVTTGSSGLQSAWTDDGK